MFSFFWSLGAFLVALTLVVAFHEYGHYFIARRCGVKILTFSIGFGKPLLSWKHKTHETQYQIAAVPLGGYVRMLDHEIDVTTEADIAKSFRSKSVFQRMAIVVAGPIANFILAVLLLWFTFMLGVMSLKPVIGNVTEQSIAYEAGLKPGDEIVAVNGVKTQTWDDISLQLIAKVGERSLQIEAIDQAGRLNQYQLDLRGWHFDPDKTHPINSLGLGFYQPKIHNKIAWVAENSPASRAGLQAEDKIIEFNGTHTEEWEQITSLIQASPYERVDLKILRDGEVLEVQAQLEAQADMGVLGVAPYIEPYPEAYIFELKYDPLNAFIQGLSQTKQLISVSLAMLKKLVVGAISVKNLSGPIGIAQGAGIHASYGLVSFLNFMALISVSLGILNLLPIPMLDGGHLLFYVIEWVRGKPVSEQHQALGFRIGIFLILMLMAVALFNDINRLLP